MSSDPIGVTVERTFPFNEAVVRDFDEVRSSRGHRPSLGDFERYYWPHLYEALVATWKSAASISAKNFDGRTIAIQPFMGMFPPARILFLVTRPDTSHHIVIQLIDMEFDWDFTWEPPNPG